MNEEKFRNKEARLTGFAQINWPADFPYGPPSHAILINPDPREYIGISIELDLTDKENNIEARYDLFLSDEHGPPEPTFYGRLTMWADNTCALFVNKIRTVMSNNRISIEPFLEVSAPADPKIKFDIVDTDTGEVMDTVDLTQAQAEQYNSINETTETPRRFIQAPSSAPADNQEAGQ